MLSDEEKREIQAEMGNYAQKEAACIEALKIVQGHRGGWVTDEALQDVAEFLEMSPSDLDAVATFYNLIFREPVGKHVILLCNSVSCWVMGYEAIRQNIKEALEIDFGGTTPDKAFTLLPTACLGICDHAPAMMVDTETFVDLDQAKIKEIFGKYRQNGQAK